MPQLAPTSRGRDGAGSRGQVRGRMLGAGRRPARPGLVSGPGLLSSFLSLWESPQDLLTASQGARPAARSLTHGPSDPQPT